MNILHYTLGLPPLRSGGLTKYSIDLMLSQLATGNRVSLIYPGGISFSNQEQKIKQHKNYKSIEVYEINNALNVSLLYGVKNPLTFISKDVRNKTSFYRFLDLIKPDIVHIHTLMGLPIQFLECVKEKKIRLVYTSHDYYGLCLKVNFIDQFNQICNSPCGGNCAVCNRLAPSNLYLRLRNSNFLLTLKDKLSAKVKMLVPKKYRISLNVYHPSNQEIRDYNALLEYYKQSFSLMDCIHFNSSIAKDVFTQFIQPNKSVVISISHDGIKDQRCIKFFDSSEKLKIAFIGNVEVYKGLPFLKNCLLKLYKQGFKQWELNVWGSKEGTDAECENIRYRGKYNSEQLDLVYSEIDLLLVPSVWKETFSLTTLEALSYGIPVIVSNNVGAKDIIAKYNNQFIFNSEDELNNLLMNILKDKSMLEQFNRTVYEKDWTYCQSDHIKAINELLYKV